MQRLILTVLLLLTLAARGAVDVDFSLADFVSNPLASRTVTLTPVQSPGGAGQRIISGDLISWDSGTNGTFTVSNIVAGAYKVDISGPSAATSFFIVVPSVYTSNVPAISIISQPLATSGSQMAYTVTASDRRYRPVPGTNVVIYTNSQGYIVLAATGTIDGGPALQVSNFLWGVISNNLIISTNLSISAYMGATNFTFSVSNSLYTLLASVASTSGVSEAYVTLRTNETLLTATNMTALATNAIWASFLSSSNLMWLSWSNYSTIAFRGSTNFTYSVSNALYSLIGSGGSGVSEAYVTARTNETLLTATNFAITAISAATNSANYTGTNFTILATNALSGVLIPLIATSSNTAVTAAITAATNAAGVMTNALMATILSVSNASYFAQQGANVVYFSPQTYTQTALSNAFWGLPNNAALVFAPGDYYVSIKHPPDGIYVNVTNADAAFKSGFKTNIAIVCPTGIARFLVTNPVATAAGDVFWSYKWNNCHVEGIAIEWPIKPSLSNTFSMAWNAVECHNMVYDRLRILRPANHGLGMGQLNDPSVGRMSTNVVIMNSYFMGAGQTNFTGSTVDGAGIEPGGPCWVINCTFELCFRGIEIEGVIGNGTQDTYWIRGCRFHDCHEYGIVNIADPSKGQRIKVTDCVFQRNPANSLSGFSYYGYYGIGAVDTQIRGCTFDQTGYGIASTGSGWIGADISNNQFYTNYTAITLRYTSGGATTNSILQNISGNTIIRCTNGIQVEALTGNIANNLLLETSGYENNNGPITVYAPTVGRGGDLSLIGNTIVSLRTNFTYSAAGITIGAGASNVLASLNKVVGPYSGEISDAGTDNLLVRITNLWQLVRMPFVIQSTNTALTNDLMRIVSGTIPYRVNSNGMLILSPDAATSTYGKAVTLLQLTSANSANAQERLRIEFKPANTTGNPSLVFALDAMSQANANGTNILQVGVRDESGTYQTNRGWTLQGDGRFTLFTNFGPANFNVYGLHTNRPTVQIMAGANHTNALEIVEESGTNRLINYTVKANGTRMINVTNNVIEAFGSGSPEGVVTGGVSSRFRRYDGPPYEYWKTNGTGNTGWHPLNIPTL